MGTLVCFHAHPDDEAISTGGIMARAHAEGHRVVLVVATDGAHGEVPEDLGPGETLVDRRRMETEKSAALLGVDRVHWLGYRDSGMTGWPQNADPDCFWQADLEEAAQRLAQVLAEERADVLTIYDWHGTYGHPDHIKVHRVGRHAAALGAQNGVLVAVYEATVNRDEMARMIAAAREMGVEGFEDFDPEAPADDGNPFGMPEAELTHRVDVGAFVSHKRAAIACHASQMSDTGFFASMDESAFAAAFGAEWFIAHGAHPPVREGWILEGVPVHRTSAGVGE